MTLDSNIPEPADQMLIHNHECHPSQISENHGPDTRDADDATPFLPAPLSPQGRPQPPHPKSKFLAIIVSQHSNPNP
jgi:hypothetical protein